MPQKVFVSKADRHTVVIDGEMHAFVKSYAHKYNISITEAVYLLLSRGLVKDVGGDPDKDKVQLPGKKI